MALTNWGDILNKPKGIDEVPEIALTVEQLSASVLSISEDVGEIAEDVQEIALEVSQLSASTLPYGPDETIKEKFDNVVIKQTIAEETYNSYALALAELKTTYDSLTDTEKLRSIIRLGDSVVGRLYQMNGRYSYSLTGSNAYYITNISLDTNQYFIVTVGSSPTFTDNSSQPQAMKIELIIL